MNLASHTMGEGKSRSWWSRGVSKLKKPTQDAHARTLTEGQQVQHGSACTDASGASGFTTVSGAVRGAAAGAAIGCSKSSSVFSHRPPASPRTMLRRPDSFTFGRQVDTRAPDPPRAHEGESPDRGAVGSCPFRRDRSSTALGELAAAAPHGPRCTRKSVFVRSVRLVLFIYIAATCNSELKIGS